jgi:hypothetical protein
MHSPFSGRPSALGIFKAVPIFTKSRGIGGLLRPKPHHSCILFIGGVEVRLIAHEHCAGLFFKSLLTCRFEPNATRPTIHVVSISRHVR